MIIGGGIKALKGVFLVTLLSGLALAVPETVINAVMGPELSVISASIVIMAVIIGCAKSCLLMILNTQLNKLAKSLKFLV